MMDFERFGRFSWPHTAMTKNDTLSHFLHLSQPSSVATISSTLITAIQRDYYTALFRNTP